MLSWFDRIAQKNSLFCAQRTVQIFVQTNLGEWQFPLFILSIGPVYFRFKGFWVVFFIFIQILIDHSVSKQ